ncbi:FMP32, mitochondrial-like protein [Tanacetum coccineum]
MIVVKKMTVVMIVVEKSMVAYFLDSCNLGTRIVDFDDTPIVIDKHVRAVTFVFQKGETVATSLSVGNLGGKYFEDAKKVEYALDLESFLRLWQKYKLPLFGYLSGGHPSRLSVGNLLENTQRIYHGTYDEMDCYVKRVPVITMGYAHFHVKLLKSCNEQSNMLRIYDARCDGLHYEIAIEKCSLNLDEFIRRKTKDRRELLRMFREIIRGIIYIHDNGIATAP